MSGNRHGRAWPLVAAATVLELCAVALVVIAGAPLHLALGGCLHPAAAFLARAAARRRRTDLSVVENDLVLCTAFFVPLFGPVLGAWIARPPQAEEAENAHAVFEQYAEHVHPPGSDYERTLFTGDYEKDLARELDAESYHSVLRHGSTDQKRNALRRLAELGEPKHFDLIRSCLLDPSHEVRLYAYSELERTGRVYEEEIAKRSHELAKRPENPEALMAMARAFLGYASSGIQDENMAAFYFRAAVRHAGEAQAAGAKGPEPVFLRAAALGKLGEFERADDCLAGLSDADQARPECCLVRAELAYRRRDFTAARAEADRMRESGAEPPSWLAAVGGKR